MDDLLRFLFGPGYAGLSEEDDEDVDSALDNCFPPTEQQAREEIRRARARAAAMMPFDDWKRLSNPTPEEEGFARLLYEEPAKTIAGYIEMFGPQVAD